MSLVEDLQKWYEDNSYPPEGEDVSAEQVSYEKTGGYARWGEPILVVYKRGEELVGVYDVEPATERQDWGDYGTPEIVPVEEYEVKVTKYQRLTDY